jgi:hypothetical protein
MKGSSTKLAEPEQDQGSIQVQATNDNIPIVVNLTLPADFLDSIPKQSPRLLSRQHAATYCGVSLETFDDYRRRGIVPDPVDGTARWDIKLIDQWLDRASGIVSDMATPLDEWRTQRDG